MTRAVEVTGVPRAAPGNQRLPSPLRYPGAKRQLVRMFNELLLDRPARTFVEPFAGGASIGLHVAVNGLAEKVVLGEADELLYAFWATACAEPEWLIDVIQSIPVTVENWERFKANPGSTTRDRATSCLFLNRTSFSGILHWRAGPIGGRKQQSKYKIDCRFPRDEIARRVKAVGELAASGRIADVVKGDYQDVLGVAKRQYGPELLLYLDPPFFAKAQTLYRLSFEQSDHKRLADYLLGCSIPWVLSYDYHPAIEDLYSTPLVVLPTDEADAPAFKHRLGRLTLNYSAHSRRGSGSEYIVTNIPRLLEYRGVSSD
ncbi:DNA adenine methylase [Cryptosporangium sp. NPDC048952]|uniref:DNA adenine methylase n=1 Tax=Cryptosporangium sp. NPDC048952 TaxID=3363961 RepID=UPI00371241DA